MAYQINLLPWREKERSNNKRRFVFELFFIIVLAAAVQSIGFNYLENQQAQQTKRNHSLETHIAQLDRELTQLNIVKK